MGAGAVVKDLWRCGWRGDRITGLIAQQRSAHAQPGRDMFVGRAVVDHDPITAIGDESCVAQDSQLFGDIRLRAVKDGLQMADAGLLARHNTENLEPDRVGQGTEELTLGMKNR
jgi:hypothetical protein